MPLIPCPYCGKEISSYAKKCPSCGKDLTQKPTQSPNANEVVCSECGIPFSRHADACPNCGEPNSNKTKTFDLATTDSKPKTNKREIPCQFCGAPILIDENQTEACCSFCGRVNPIPEPANDDSDEEAPLPQDAMDGLYEAIHSLTETISGKSVEGYLEPKIADSACRENIIKELVTTDHIPTDIFDTFAIEELTHTQYPIYEVEFNWSAQWSARYSKQISHQEPTYDYNGKRTGTKTVYETIYRDSNGTSAGDVVVCINGCENGVSYDVLNYIEDSSSLIGNVRALDDKKDNGWEYVQPSFSINEAIENERNHAEHAIDSDVDTTTYHDASRMAGYDWSVDDVHYTYEYRRRNCRCVLFPIIGAQYKYRDNVFSAQTDAVKGKVILVTPPKDEDEKRKVKNIVNQGEEYKKKQTGWYSAFGASYVIMVVLFFCCHPLASIFAAIASILFFHYARKNQTLNYKSQNEIKQILYASREKRNNAAKRKYNIDANIGNKVQKKEVSHSLDYAVYSYLIISIISAVFLFPSLLLLIFPICMSIYLISRMDWKWVRKVVDDNYDTFWIIVSSVIVVAFFIFLFLMW